MQSKLRKILVSIFTLLVLTFPLVACTCVPDEITTDAIKGQVFTIIGEDPNSKHIFPNAKVRLLKIKSERVVAETVTDENGNFVINNVKPGKYILQAYGKFHAKRSALVTLIRTSKQKKDELEIGLDPRIGEYCCESHFKLRGAV